MNVETSVAADEEVGDLTPTGISKIENITAKVTLNGLTPQEVTPDGQVYKVCAEGVLPSGEDVGVCLNIVPTKGELSQYIKKLGCGVWHLPCSLVFDSQKFRFSSACVALSGGRAYLGVSLKTRNSSAVQIFYLFLEGKGAFSFGHNNR